jgi:hypothetical protein
VLVRSTGFTTRPIFPPISSPLPSKIQTGTSKGEGKRYESFEAWEMELGQQRNSIEIVMKALYWLEQKFRDIFQQKTIGNFFPFVFQ